MKKAKYTATELLSTYMSRRAFLSGSAQSIGALALGNILPSVTRHSSIIIPKAKRIIYLCQSGGPSQFELFDYKPLLTKLHGSELPASIRGGQRLTAMSAGQSSLPVVQSPFKFNQYGKSGAWVSDLLPYTSRVVDDLCFIKSMYTEQINHDPALTFLQTGHQLAGMPSMGSWLTYGLGSENENLPSFVVLVSNNAPNDQPLYARLWGNGFLPSRYQGVQLRAGNDPVLYLKNPDGYESADRRKMLDALHDLLHVQMDRFKDPSIQDKIASYEMAFRMQTSVPEVTDLSDEPDSIFELYGKEARTPGTYAANCLMARRLAERNVRFIQLYHQGWDNHDSLQIAIKPQAKATDQASAALITDLKRRGLLDDTIVIWGGEFGRTVYSQGKLSADNYGRDHHPKCFTTWVAGGGIKGGMDYGKTDDYGYNIVQDPVHVHDFHATLLHLLGIDHEKLTYQSQGRRYRLTDVSGKVINNIIA